MTLRRTTNPGKREREARKRHRRARYWSSRLMGAEAAPLKLGRRKADRWLLGILVVADSRKLPKGAKESVCSSSPGLIPGGTAETIQDNEQNGPGMT